MTSPTEKDITDLGVSRPERPVPVSREEAAAWFRLIRNRLQERIKKREESILSRFEKVPGNAD